MDWTSPRNSQTYQLIPKESLQLLPFIPEAIAGWNISTLDIVKFLTHLFDKEGTIIDSSGRETTVNYRSYWKTIYDDGLEKFKRLAGEFEAEARNHAPVPASVVASVHVPSFIGDASFGKVAKYYIAYDGLLSEVLAESFFYSIAHILESKQELDCSIIMAKNLYYKQALQVLRNYIELMVSQLLFCYNAKAFKEWREGQFRLPRLRGKGGLLETLLKASLISSELSIRTSQLYAELNSCIHSMEGNLIHRGAYKGKYKGFLFDYDYFNDWCDSFSSVVGTGILLLNAHLEQYAASKTAETVCTICHSKNDFEVEEEEFAGKTYLRLRCKICKNEILVAK